MRLSREFACLAYMSHDCVLTYAAIAAETSIRSISRMIGDSPCLGPYALERGTGVSGQPEAAIDYVLRYSRRPEATDQERYLGRLVVHHRYRYRDESEGKTKRVEFHPDVLVTSQEHANELAAASGVKLAWWNHI